MSIRIKLISAMQAAAITCLSGMGSSSAPAQTPAAVVNEAPYAPSRNEVEKGSIKNLANAFGTKPAQNPPEGPKPASLDKYVDQVNQANGHLAGKQAGTTTPPSNPVVAESQPAAPNPQVRSAPNAPAPSQPVELTRVIPQPAGAKMMGNEGARENEGARG
jgi:hypothetical protein